MNSKNWIKLFLTTLFLGAASALLISTIEKGSEYVDLLQGGQYKELLIGIVSVAGLGLLFSIISQMGFFAYLTVHRFGLGIFRGYWGVTQIVLIVFTLFDLVYFRYSMFGTKGESVIDYIWPAVIVGVIGLAVAYWKQTMTTKAGFIPTLFFMISITVVEWIPALRENESEWMNLMLFSLVVCNAYQVLILHKLNERSAADAVARQQRKAQKA